MPHVESPARNPSLFQNCCSQDVADCRGIAFSQKEQVSSQELFRLQVWKGPHQLRTQRAEGIKTILDLRA
jgi:hypothetical protein